MQLVGWLFSPPLRPAVAALQRFMDTAGDLAEQASASPLPDRTLERYRADLQAVARGHRPSGHWPQVFDPLQRALRRHALPVALLESILASLEEASQQRRYPDRDALLEHCSRSANALGRLLLHLHGVRDDASLRQSDALCTALQLITFWQNLGTDLRKGRLYVPLEDCAREAVDPEQLLELRPDRATRRLVASEVQWARELLRQGTPLAKRLPGRAGWELRMVVQRAYRLLEKIETAGHDTLTHRPVLRWHDTPVMLLRACRM